MEFLFTYLLNIAPAGRQASKPSSNPPTRFRQPWLKGFEEEETFEGFNTMSMDERYKLPPSCSSPLARWNWRVEG